MPVNLILPFGKFNEYVEILGWSFNNSSSFISDKEIIVCVLSLSYLQRLHKRVSAPPFFNPVIMCKTLILKPF